MSYITAKLVEKLGLDKKFLWDKAVAPTLYYHGHGPIPKCPREDFTNTTGIGELNKPAWEEGIVKYDRQMGRKIL